MNLATWLGQQRGRQTALAARLHIKPPQVAAWIAPVRPKQVPLDHCPLIQAFTEGQVTCEELRPDKVEYFRLIREQPAGALPPTPPAPIELALVDRRDPAHPSAYAGTDMDRRAPPLRAMPLGEALADEIDRSTTTQQEG